MFKSSTSCLALVLLACSSSAQLVFEPPTAIPSANGGLALDVADLDGDGTLDVISGGQGHIAISQGLGDGSFGVVTEFTGRAAPFALADVDEDGVLDLIHVSLGFPEQVAVSLGTPGAEVAFGAPAVVSPVPASSIESLDVGDVNGDGHVDVAYSSGSFFILDRFVLVGAGDGTFALGSQLPSGVFAFVALADVDGDGLDDVVSGGEWAASTGDGTFTADVPFAGEVLGDVLGDARVESFEEVETPDGLVLSILSADTATAGAPFVEVATTPPISLACSTPFVSPVDVDADGLVDLVVTCGGAGVVLRQSAPAVFEWAGAIPSADDLISAVVGGDLDVDGRRDLVLRGLFGGPQVSLNATYTATEPFIDLGFATPGVDGFPVQLLSSDGVSLDVRVVRGAPNAPVFAVFGGSTVDAPFQGGVLVPSPDRVVGPFALDALGELTAGVPDAFPLAFGVDLFVQWWIVDDAGPAGFAATTAVRIAAP